MKKIMLLAWVAAGVLPLMAATGVPGVVTADRLNLRLAPELKSPVAARLQKGARLQIVGTKGNWLAVSAPETVKVYVSEAYISHGKTIAAIRMHSDKSSTSPCLGVLPAGTAVKLIDDRGYGWVRIETPENIRLYTAKMYVDFDAAQLTAQEVQAAKVAEAPVQPADLPAAPATAENAIPAPAAPAAEPLATPGLPVTKIPADVPEAPAAPVAVPAPQEDAK